MALILLARTFAMISTCCIAGTCIGGGLLYFQYIRLSRPPVGVFDTGDIIPLLISLLLLPLLYLALSPLILTILLTLIIMGTLQTGLRPLFTNRMTWTVTLVLLVTTLGTALLAQQGWQLAAPLHLIINDLLLLFMVIVAANINVQYGMRLSYVAWYALLLAGYDAFFMWVIPLTPLLATRLVGLAFNLSFGIVLGSHQMYLGIGDMFMFTLVACTAYKGFGRKGIAGALIVIGIFGVLFPTVGLPLLLALLGIKATFIPVQLTCGPAIFVLWYWLSRHAPERTVAQWSQAREKSSECKFAN